MARIFTLGELVSLGKQYADQENSGFISDAEWRGYFSSAYAVLYSTLVESGMRYFESTDVYTVTDDPWTLPEDFLSTIGVDYLEDGTLTGNRYQLREHMAQERNIYAGVTSGGNRAYRYALVGQELKLLPTPKTGDKYAHVYIPQPAKLTDDNTKIDVVTPDGEQFLIWYAVFLARDKEDSDVRSALRERENALRRVTEWAQLRAFHAPRTPMVEQEFTDGEFDVASWWWNRGGR